jgi:hypothetical protein
MVFIMYLIKKIIFKYIMFFIFHIKKTLTNYDYTVYLKQKSINELKFL